MSFIHSRTPRTTGNYDVANTQVFVRVLSKDAGVSRKFIGPVGVNARQAQDFLVLVIGQLKGEGLTYAYGDSYETVMRDSDGNKYFLTISREEVA